MKDTICTIWCEGSRIYKFTSVNQGFIDVKNRWYNKL